MRPMRGRRPTALFRARKCTALRQQWYEHMQRIKRRAPQTHPARHSSKPTVAVYMLAYVNLLHFPMSCAGWSDLLAHIALDKTKSGSLPALPNPTCAQLYHLQDTHLKKAFACLYGVRGYMMVTRALCISVSVSLYMTSAHNSAADKVVQTQNTDYNAQQNISLPLNDLSGAQEMKAMQGRVRVIGNNNAHRVLDHSERS